MAAGCSRSSLRNRFPCSGHCWSAVWQTIVSRFFSSRLCMFLLGCMLYLPLITLIFYRFTFVNVTTASLTPPYWINMGAVAITTLAGARLIIAAPGWPLLNEVVPFLKGFTLFFWAAGTWWIPLLFSTRILAARLQKVSTEIRPAILGHGLSVWNVHGLHVPTRKRD